MTVNLALGQEDPQLQTFRRTITYGPSRDYRGPNADLSTKPFAQDEPSTYGIDPANGDGIGFSDERISRSRERNLPNRTANRRIGGSSPFGNEARESEETDAEDRSQIPFSPVLAKILFALVLGALVIFLVFQVRKAGWFRRKSHQSESAKDAWNPTTLPESEFEERLAAALRQNDYRTCVRIYFTYLLKENIRLNRIHWKRAFTNRDYCQQLEGKKGAAEFRWAVSVFEQTWYGTTPVSTRYYAEIEPSLRAYYKQLTAEHETN